jgi:hypothetical protein
MTDTFRNLLFGIDDNLIYFLVHSFSKITFLKKKLMLKIHSSTSTGKNWNYMNMLASLGRCWWQHRQCVAAEVTGSTQNCLHNQHSVMSIRVYQFPSNCVGDNFGSKAHFLWQLARFKVSGFGGLGVACWPLGPKFAGSNPAEAVGFLRAKKPSARLPSEGK